MEETSKFWVKVNGELLFELEVGGSPGNIKHFEEKVIRGPFGIFGEWSSLGKVFLHEMEVTISTIFRDKAGKFVNPRKLIEVIPHQE